MCAEGKKEVKLEESQSHCSVLLTWCVMAWKHGQLTAMYDVQI
jgi:hypothetical protein